MMQLEWPCWLSNVFDGVRKLMCFERPDGSYLRVSVEVDVFWTAWWKLLAGISAEYDFWTINCQRQSSALRHLWCCWVWNLRNSAVRVSMNLMNPHRTAVMATWMSDTLIGQNSDGLHIPEFWSNRQRKWSFTVQSLQYRFGTLYVIVVLLQTVNDDHGRVVKLWSCLFTGECAVFYFVVHASAWLMAQNAEVIAVSSCELNITYHCLGDSLFILLLGYSGRRT